MREIKFRAWCEPKKKYFFADEMVRDQFTLLPNGYFANISGHSTSESVIYTHEQYLPEQFTGLHDKNGREIYEGDILQLFEGVVFVEFQSPSFVMKEKKRSKQWIEFTLAHTEKQFGEVIGNIHENKELLS